MIEFHAKPPRRKSRHIAPAIQFSAYIIGKQAQIDLVRLYGEDRFRFRAIKSGPALRKILHQKFAVWIQRSGIVSTIGHAITIDIGTAHENIIADPVMECIDFPRHGTGSLAQRKVDVIGCLAAQIGIARLESGGATVRTFYVQLFR